MSSAERFLSNRRLLVISAFSIANAFIWYFLAATSLQNVIDKVANNNYSEIALMWTAHFLALFISFIGGTLLLKKINRKSLFTFWILLGIFSPLVLLSINFAPVPLTFLVATLFGVSLGLGMPQCVEYFTKITATEKHGRYGGIIILASGLVFFALGTIDLSNTLVNALLLTIWRLPALVIIFIPTFSEKKEVKYPVSYKKILVKREFILYFIPWIMFSLVNYLSTPIQYHILDQSKVESLIIIENALVGIFAVAGGLLADKFGRKRTSIAGFVLLGLGFAVLGLFPYFTPSWYLYTVFDGVAWGILYVIFVITIWGELGHESQSDKYYAIGVMPFFISKFLQLIIGNYLQTDISPYALFSFIAFFLFIAVLPLFYAPETLPEKTMKDRDLKSYLEKAKKIAAKEDLKSQKQTEKAEQAVAVKEEQGEHDEQYTEARKLAEKYY